MLFLCMRNIFRTQDLLETGQCWKTWQGHKQRTRENKKGPKKLNQERENILDDLEDILLSSEEDLIPFCLLVSVI